MISLITWSKNIVKGAEEDRIRGSKFQPLLWIFEKSWPHLVANELDSLSLSVWLFWMLTCDEHYSLIVAEEAPCTEKQRKDWWGWEGCPLNEWHVAEGDVAVHFYFITDSQVWALDFHTTFRGLIMNG